ncbi:DUF4402 domain-containing protein [Fusobacterium sp. MFO224]|uniref:DUF4402 domain-containing protein n=1 Tax=Fusobacterium sp. MFO224 TaxID=3378070 RepID=UPI003853C12B
MKKILFFILSSIIFAKNVGTGIDVTGNLNINANVIANLTVTNNGMEFNDIPLASDAIAFTDVNINGSAGNQNTVTVTIPKTVPMKDGDKIMILNLSSEKTERLVLDENGKAKVNIKGTLSAQDTTVIGDYTGTFDISVKYD